MGATTFLEFYRSDFQSVYALWVVPLAFLLHQIVRSRARLDRSDPVQGFLHVYFVVFSLETLLDPFATGPLLRWLQPAAPAFVTAVPLVFVLLGDFRVYLLFFSLAALWSSPPRRLAPAFLQAAGWTLLVPVFAYAVDSVLHARHPDLPEETIWLVYELAFLSVALWFYAVGIGRRVEQAARRRRLEAVATYVAVYYALWAASDLLILVLGLDLGWALRVLPNQLYYSIFLPYVSFQLSSDR